MIERTVLEIARYRFWAWQRRHAPTPLTKLRETDQLLGLVEECRVRRIDRIPAPLWRRVVHLLGQIDSRFTQKLGIDRSVELTSDVLFDAQEALMLEEQLRKRPQPDKVVRLFPQ